MRGQTLMPLSRLTGARRLIGSRQYDGARQGCARRDRCGRASSHRRARHPCTSAGCSAATSARVPRDSGARHPPSTSDGADGSRVSSVARPARRVEYAGIEIRRMSGRQNRVIVAGWALSRTDVTNAAVAMIDVVPVHEAGGERLRQSPWWGTRAEYLTIRKYDSASALPSLTRGRA
jgi:hypothetical protein